LTGTHQQQTALEAIDLSTVGDTTRFKWFWGEMRLLIVHSIKVFREGIR